MSLFLSLALLFLFLLVAVYYRCRPNIPVSEDIGQRPADPVLALVPEKPKSVRSKERRRRGKDPLRDFLKNGKKLKKLNLSPAELDSINTVKPSEIQIPSKTGSCDVDPPPPPPSPTLDNINIQPPSISLSVSSPPVLVTSAPDPPPVIPSCPTPPPPPPPPSLTTQTQIASLRGALEAARQREAQLRLELERHAKDLESICWEKANWKRREFELQYQVQYLAHQLQSFAVSMNFNNASSRNSSSSPRTSPGNNSFQVPLPPEHLHPLYYPYPHPFPVQRPANHHPNLMATFSPRPVASPSPGPLSGPSSATSSSAGSMSPEGVDRGRRKTRVWLDDDAVFLDERNDDGVSDILADAILKRPGTLGLGKARTKSTDSTESQPEFTFPSLSDFGNIRTPDG